MIYCAAHNLLRHYSVIRRMTLLEVNFFFNSIFSVLIRINLIISRPNNTNVLLVLPSQQFYKNLVLITNACLSSTPHFSFPSSSIWLRCMCLKVHDAVYGFRQGVFKLVAKIIESVWLCRSVAKFLMICFLVFSTCCTNCSFSIQTLVICVSRLTRFNLWSCDAVLCEIVCWIYVC